MNSKIMMKSDSITHVLYDMDGLLLDTENYYTIVNRNIAHLYGKAYDPSLKPKTMGLKAVDSARILIDELGLPLTPEEYLQARKGMLDEFFPRSEPKPGAVRLTRHLHSHNIPQAVATSTNRHHFELKTTRHKDWFKIFECFVIGDDPEVKEGKPSPDIFLVAASKMKAQPERCLVFEDAPSGVKAARAAGMHVIAVPDSNMAHYPFPEADEILASLEEFDPAKWGLPPLS
ncbi:MAG: (DL)-glycerol-3-phosphatase 2 [Acidobacteria bacterium]|nr:(DL)-glycerol-3-phosphatase 2 [Acidobacteriota bacterium]